jgi:serine protease inhibitor
LQKDYLNLVQESFPTDVKLENFTNDSAKLVQSINAWVEKQTNQGISSTELLLYLPKFKVDHPFIFTVQESRREITLFQGKFVTASFLKKSRDFI